MIEMDVQWKSIGQVDVIGGSLVFPKASTAHGCYWFAVAKGPDVVAGYIGQAAGEKGFAQRFRGYRGRVRNPQFNRDGSLGTTSKIARWLLDALDHGYTVQVSVIDDPALADDAVLDALETDLIGQLCASGVDVWNVKHVVDQAAREIRVLSVIRPDPAGQAAHDTAFQLIPEELRAPRRTSEDTCNALTWRARQDSNPRPAA